MSLIKNLNPRLVNKSEIARKLGLSPRYINYLLKGERKNAERLRQIHELISKELQADKAA